jgi:hypothetical protein
MRDLQEIYMWSSFTIKVTPDKSLGLIFAKPDGLAVIKSVVSGEQCDITGQVRPGDKVVRVDNTVINTPLDIDLVMRRKRYERTVTLKLVTKDKRQGRPTTRGGQRRGLAMKVFSCITRSKRLGLQHTHTHTRTYTRASRSGPPSSLPPVMRTQSVRSTCLLPDPRPKTESTLMIKRGHCHPAL